MSHFGLSYDDCMHNLPYRLLVFLSGSVPRYKSKKEKPKDINEILMGVMPTE